MYEHLEKVLSTLNIPFAYQEYNGKADAYIIFSVFNDIETEFTDDSNLSCTYYINITYWKNKKDVFKIAKTIKELLKANGFMYLDGRDIKNDGYYAKTMDFIFEELKEV